MFARPTAFPCPDWFAVAVGAAALCSCIRGQPGRPAASASTTRDDYARAQQGQQASQGHFHVLGRHLYDRCGERVVLRGVNKMVIWTDPEGDSFAEIARTGANTVRIVWTVKDHPGEDALDRVLARAIEARLIPIIELHDATGKLDQVPAMVDFWVRPEIVAVLKKHEASLLLNVANEPGSGRVALERYVEVYAKAIGRLRAAGLAMPLLVDAPDWGHDPDTLQASAPALLEADPAKNLMFSLHAWWPQGKASADPGSKKRIRNELEESVEMGIPLVVAEFAPMGPGCSRFVDYDALLSEAQRHEIGWLAWSWGPGNNDCGEMDMTEDSKFETLHGWGKDVALDHRHSIKNTSKIPESMYRGECARTLE